MAELGLWMHLPRLRARRTRERLAAAGAQLSVDQVYNLTLAETESEDKASEAASAYAAELLRRGRTPE